VALACTAAAAGAAVANHAEAAALLKDSHGHVVGARVTDKETGRAFEVHARVVVNATGPWADEVRHLSDPAAKDAVTASAGAHVTLPDYYVGGGAGMIVPKTKDGRVVFMLPWQGRVIAGTTDAPIKVGSPGLAGSVLKWLLL
jgi:glycerol-3-phosphate dehydrogenase